VNLRLRMYAEITGLRKELTEGRFYPPKGDFSRRDTEFETNSLLLHQNQRQCILHVYRHWQLRHQGRKRKSNDYSKQCKHYGW